MEYPSEYLKRLDEITRPFNEAKTAVFQARELLWKEYVRIESLKAAAIRDLMQQMGVENEAVRLLKSGKNIYHYYWNDGYDQTESYGFTRFHDKNIRDTDGDLMTNEQESAVIEALDLGLIEPGDNLYEKDDDQVEYPLRIVEQPQRV